MLADLLSETLETDFDESWENERTAIASGRSPSASTPPVVRSEKHKKYCDCSALNGLTRRSGSEYIGSLTAFPTRRRARERSSRVPIRTRRVLMTAQPTRVAVDETAVKINGEWSWLYAAIDLDTKLILGVELFGRHGTDPAAAFLHKLTEQHDLSEAELLVDQFDYRTVLARS